MPESTRIQQIRLQTSILDVHEWRNINRYQRLFSSSTKSKYAIQHRKPGLTRTRILVRHGQHIVCWQLVDDNSFSYSFALRMSGPINHHVWKCLEFKNTDTKYIKARPPWCISINRINESMAMFALEQNQITFDINSITSPHWWSESILVN